MRKRILFDSNVWRYLLDCGAVPELRSAARASRHTIVMSPAVYYEAARTGEVGVRNRLLDLMLLPDWKRLMPEAYQETAEIRAEVERTRPEWLRVPTEVASFKKLRHDWLRARGGNWDRIRSRPAVLPKVEGNMMTRAREQAAGMRNDARVVAPKWRRARLTEMTSTFNQPVRGWNGEPFESWRGSALTVFIHAARFEETTREWLGGYVELDMMLFQEESLVRFWLHDTDTAKMPRHWLRWAFEFQQRLYKLTPGTPVDAQIGTYLMDCDLLLSADKDMVRISQKCREDAPFPVGASELVPAGTGCVEAVLRQLRLS